MDKVALISKIEDELHAYQSYIETHFEEFDHSSVTSHDLYDFGRHTFYVLSAISESLKEKL